MTKIVVKNLVTYSLLGIDAHSTFQCTRIRCTKVTHLQEKKYRYCKYFCIMVPEINVQKVQKQNFFLNNFYKKLGVTGIV